MIYSQFIFGETAVYFCQTRFSDETSIGLVVAPKERAFDDRACFPDPLIQVAFTGDRSLIDYSRGVTMKNREAALVKILSQTADADGVVTRLTDGKGNFYTHTLRYFSQTGVFSVQTEYENRSEEARTLESLQSVCISVLPVGGARRTFLYRMTSGWSRECRLQRQSFSSLGMENSWADYGVKNERWGQVGSMPNRGYYPFMAVEDARGAVWAMTQDAPSSWQMEVSVERKNHLSLSGGLADYEFGHWRRTVAPHERFSSHRAYFAVREGGGLNAVCNAFLHTADSLLRVPETEERMPVLFNEYCTSWGCPSAENIKRILHAISGLPVGIFVIDCGWFKREGAHWSVSGGDWQENRTLFPDGMGAIAKLIGDSGYIPGVWFEYETAGRESELYTREELLLQRDGVTITGKNRRFVDLRKREAQKYLQTKVVDFLKENGFSYLKIDYNDSFGVGCDGAESVGEGGRQMGEESIRFLDKLKEALPDLIIENCASGGSRIEPYRMSKVAQCSFSDAHECTEIPFVAANVSRVVPARQMQIWAVIRQTDSLGRIIYSLCAAMMGRICLSGDVIHLSREQRACIEEGLNFYERVKEVVRYGDIEEIDCSVASYRNQRGRQIYRKVFRDEELILVHFANTRGRVVIRTAGKPIAVYAGMEYSFADGALQIFGKPYSAGAFFIKRTEEKT